MVGIFVGKLWRAKGKYLPCLKSHPCSNYKLTKFFNSLHTFFHRMTNNNPQKTHLKTAKPQKNIRKLQQKILGFDGLTCGLKLLAPWGMTCHWITSSVRELQGSLEDLEADRSKEGATSTAFLIITKVCSAKKNPHFTTSHSIFSKMDGFSIFLWKINTYHIYSCYHWILNIFPPCLNRRNRMAWSLG